MDPQSATGSTVSALTLVLEGLLILIIPHAVWALVVIFVVMFAYNFHASYDHLKLTRIRIFILIIVIPHVTDNCLAYPHVDHISYHIMIKSYSRFIADIWRLETKR